MNPKPPKIKIATATMLLTDLAVGNRWTIVESAVNAVLAQFQIKTKIMIYEKAPFLVVEGERRRSPRPRKDQAWQSPLSFSCRALGKIERVHVGDYYQEVAGGLVQSIGSSHEFANQIVGATNAGGMFYRGLGR